jgi:hypothetical protein
MPLIALTPILPLSLPLTERSSTYRPTSTSILKQIFQRHLKSVCQFDQCPDRWVPTPAFQVGQVAPLDRRPVRKDLLGPAVDSSQMLDAFGESVEGSGFRDGQSPNGFRLSSRYVYDPSDNRVVVKGKGLWGYSSGISGMLFG